MMVATLSSQNQLLNTLVEKSDLLSWIKGKFIGHHLREISMRQVERHNKIDDCWIILYDKIYDITFFINKHPGGAEVMLEYAGRDATFAFESIGHDLDVLKKIQQNLIGQLPKDERIFLSKDELRPRIV
ncbi:unnamed protein product [Bemisia tabaci]|uniref:Cytochrome b5 heme-binding domain-containing protein n=1 Tax=Bemisia tabaci TaxID=7038 RepID=A0A9P0EVA1_BEMTA|nr:unnamed protein product [Bemisia tabaci]